MPQCPTSVFLFSKLPLGIFKYRMPVQKRYKIGFRDDEYPSPHLTRRTFINTMTDLPLFCAGLNSCTGICTVDAPKLIVRNLLCTLGVLLGINTYFVSKTFNIERQQCLKPRQKLSDIAFTSKHLRDVISVFCGHLVTRMPTFRCNSHCISGNQPLQ